MFATFLPPVLLVFLLTLGLTSAQEIVAPSARRAPATIFDEIADAAERRAFREVWEASAPRLQRDLAARFIERFPRSVVLREAYELAARANVASGDLAAGLDWSQRSLRLLPENPSLLVMVADTAIRQRQFDLAETSARDALRYLEHADRPPSVDTTQWTAVVGGLRSTAQVVLGRVAATNERYADAEAALVAALALTPDDTEATSLLRVVREARGRDPGTATPRPAPPAAIPRAADPGDRYAGSTACRDCHPRVYERWQATGMARMLRSYRAENVIGDFSGRETVSGSARAITAGDRHFLEIRNGSTQQWVRYPVDYTIGSKWQQAYATRLPDNRIVVFPVQYSRLHGQWLNYWKMVDAPGTPRTDISRFHEVPEDAVYQTTCAPCHTSQLAFQRRTHDPADATFREGGVNCEMCHGPSLGHVEGLKKGSRTGGPTPVRFKDLSPAESVAVCAQCHAQSAIHDAQPGGAVNFAADGSSHRTYPTHLLSSFPRSAFYRDGRYRATTFISEAFARSQCHRQGGATCVSCHDPHPADAAQNPTSLKFDDNEMCLQCHTSLRDAIQRHTRHDANSEASRCVSCHMPRIAEALLFKARSHEIDDVPDVAMTERFGPDESPNACLSCHRDRDVPWLRRTMAEWRAPLVAVP